MRVCTLDGSVYTARSGVRGRAGRRLWRFPAQRGGVPQALRRTYRRPPWPPFDPRPPGHAPKAGSLLELGRGTRARPTVSGRDLARRWLYSMDFHC